MRNTTIFVYIIISQSIFIEFSLNTFCFSEQGSVGEVTLAECQRKKGENLECNKLDSDHQEEGGLRKNSSKPELPPLTSDKDAVQAKSKCQTAKACRSQSGPLTPGVELSHSASERSSNFERSYTVLFNLLYHVLRQGNLKSDDSGTNSCFYQFM